MHINPTNIVNMPCTKIRSKRATAQSHNNSHSDPVSNCYMQVLIALQRERYTMYIKIDIYFFSENISLIFRRLLAEIYARVVGILAKRERVEGMLDLIFLIE